MGSRTSNGQLASTALFFLIIIFISSNPVHSITCQDALQNLLPCLSFAAGTAPPPPSPGCCSGVQTLAGLANTTEDRRTVCRCYKDIAPSLGIKPERVQEIPQDCKVNVTIPTDPNVDCNSIP